MSVFLLKSSNDCIHDFGAVDIKSGRIEPVTPYVYISRCFCLALSVIQDTV
jgi:hypothetical protein